MGTCQWDVCQSWDWGKCLNNAAAVSAHCLPQRVGNTAIGGTSVAVRVRYKKFAWSRGGRNMKMCALIMGCAVTQPASDQHFDFHSFCQSEVTLYVILCFNLVFQK